jgi:signal transduction histidine kinase/PAS domain-containing protein
MRNHGQSIPSAGEAEREIKFLAAMRQAGASPTISPIQESIVAAITTELRKPGISLLGDMPWGTHFCHFYETKEDLLHTVVPYFKAGLESNECCVWVVSEPVSEEEARDALRPAVPDFDRYEANGSLEILSGRDWYFREGVFDRERVSSAWIEKLDRALARGYDGMRVSGNAFGFGSTYWKAFCEYEKDLNELVNDKPMTILCTYSLPASSAGEVLDISPMHQFAIATRNGNSALIEPPRAMSERKRAEQELRRSEAYLAEAQRLSHTASWAWNVSSGELFWSLEHFRICDLDPEKFKPTVENARQLIHPEDRPLVNQTFDRAVRERSSFEWEFRIVRPDGTIRYIHSLGHPVFSQSGELIEYVGTIIDSTEHKRSEQRLAMQYAITRALAESDTLAAATPNLLKAIGESMQFHWGALWVIDRKAALISCQSIWHAPKIEAAEFDAISRKTRFTLGQGFPGQVWQRSECIWSESIWTDDAMKNPNYVRAPIAARMGLRAAIGFPIVVAGEPLGVLEFFSRAVGQPDGEQLATLSAIGSQIGQFVERKNAEEGLHAARAELARVSRFMTMGQLTASIAHELNQPLAAIATNATAGLSWLAATTPDLDQARQALGRIIRDGNRVGDVIARIRMLLTKNESGKERLDINEPIQEVVALAQGEVRRNQMELRTELAGDLPPVLGDRVQLQQVVLNLIMNGIEAMSEITDRPRELVIKTQRDEVDTMRVTVQDSGIGIDPESLARIFEAFYTTKPHGMGIGLSISRTIIESHGGRLWGERNDGPGATFGFTLPSYQAGPA